MQVTIPQDHVHDFRFMVAEQVERDEELIREAEEKMPGANTSGVVRRIAFYQQLSGQVAS
jgi:hypothetical protein